MVGKIIDEISYIVLLMRHMDERERNILIHTEEFHGFCGENYIETKIKP